MMTLEEIRKELHQIPELGRCEYKTKEWIVSYLKPLSCELYFPTPTAVVAYFNRHQAKTICFRADMDALPMEEKTGLSFASIHSGRMHACGHDGHMTILLGLASWIDEHLSMLSTNVVCLFQPSEEDNAGANEILKSGILEQLSVNEIVGFHLWPMLEKNKIYSMPGAMLASATELDVVILGKTVHAANRKDGIDAILSASHFLSKIYEWSDALSLPHLLSFGSIEGIGARNAVCSKVVLKGTLRAFDECSYETIKTQMIELIQQLEVETQSQIQIHFNHAYPSVENDRSLFEKYQKCLALNTLEQPFLQAEDFGCYTQHYPCLFLLLGIGNEHLLHTPTFDFPMDVLSTGVEAYKLILLNS